VILRVAGTCDGEYEEGQHRWIAAERAAMSADEIAAAVDPAIGHVWSADDAALLGFVDEVLAEGTVTDGTWEGLASWGDTRRMELLVLIGFYRMLAVVTNGLGVELDPSVADVLKG
jgi:alkylhydroperoxidase family enzyme